MSNDSQQSESGAVEYPWQFNTHDASTNLEKYAVLFNSWEYSKKLLAEINIFLVRFYAQMEDAKTFTVAVAGSFGRMEASKQSDLDFMIFSTAALSSESKTLIIEGIRECSTAFNVTLPDSNGVFGRITQYGKLISRIGARDETIHDLAERMLLLMESRALYNKEIYQTTIESVLSGYLWGMENDPTKEALFMLNDVIRYFRSVCVHYQPGFWRQGNEWAIHGVKLWHSRIIMYGGLLLTILNASIKPDKVAYLRRMVVLSPLERIISVYQEANDDEYEKVLKLYDAFLERVQDDGFREKLAIPYEYRYSSNEYQEMKSSSLALMRELARFVFEQRGRWTDQVLDYLIF